MIKLSRIKNSIKHDPNVLKKKPWLLSLLPLLFINVVWNRIKYKSSIVYFVDTDINEYLINKKLREISDFETIKITSFQQFQYLVESRLAEDFSMDISYLSLCQKRFESGAFVYAFCNKELPVSYVFLVTDHVVISQVDFKMSIPQDTFAFIDLYTFKKYRRRGYHQKLYDSAIFKMKRDGYNHFWCWLMAHNQISIKAHCKLGINNVTKIIKRISFLGLSKTNIKDTKKNLNELIMIRKPQI